MKKNPRFSKPPKLNVKKSSGVYGFGGQPKPVNKPLYDIKLQVIAIRTPDIGDLDIDDKNLIKAEDGPEVVITTGMTEVSKYQLTDFREENVPLNTDPTESCLGLTINHRQKRVGSVSFPLYSLMALGLEPCCQWLNIQNQELSDEFEGQFNEDQGGMLRIRVKLQLVHRVIDHAKAQEEKRQKMKEQARARAA